MKVVLPLLAVAIFAAAPVAAGTTPPRIAFDYAPDASHPDVATTAPDGSDLRNLTPGTPAFFTADMHPSWSPDGTQIAFDSHRDSNTSQEIYVMDADGSNQRRLTEGSGGNGIFDVQPHWSPRGDLIEFLQDDNGQNDDLWVVRPDGSGLRRLTSDGGIKGDVSWAPDGDRILYVRNEGGGSRIYRVDLDGSGPVVLSPPEASDSSPAWSPDGTQIAFTSPELSVMDANGANRLQIVSMPAASPVWSPDGSEIAFTGIRPFPRYGNRFGIPSRQDVFVVNPYGGDLRRLTGPFDVSTLEGPWASVPTWWPDGSRLFYVSQRNYGPSTTFVMNADGSCESMFAPDEPGLLDPVWQPGGGPLPPITRCAELRLSASVAKSPLALGESVVFTFTVDNDGNLPATAGVVDIPIDGAVDWAAQTANCSVSATDVVCQLAEVPPGGSVSVAASAYRLTAGPIRVTAHVDARELDTDITNNAVTAGADVLPCTIVGSYGPDVLVGTDGPDRICGLPGADTIYAWKGNDFIDAGNGDDRIYPGPGRDTVIAKGGDDVIYARDGQRDWIDCGAGYDVVVADREDVTRHCEAVSRPPR